MAESRFVSYDERDLQDFLTGKISKNTGSATKTALTLLQLFCSQTDEYVDFDHLSPVQLDKLLRIFYAGVRKASQMNIIIKPHP